MKGCEHIRAINFQDLGIISDKLLMKQCEACKKKIDLYISLQDLRVLCLRDLGESKLQIRKDLLQVCCKACDKTVAIENTSLRKLVSKLPAQIKFNRTLGCTGLANLGNTCYINVTIQALSHLYCMKKYFLSYVANKSTQGILKEFCNVMDCLWRGDIKYEAKNFIIYIDNEYATAFNRRRHQDTSEFLSYFLDTLDRNLKTQINSNFMTQALAWKVCSSYICLKCQNNSKVIEEYTDLPLCIPTKQSLRDLKITSTNYLTPRDQTLLQQVNNNVWKKLKLFIRSNTTEAFSLYDCLNSHFQTEKMSDPQNLRNCEKCNSPQPCEKTPKIDSLPPVLIIYLKRYHSTTSKYPIHIQLPLQLNLNPFSKEGKLPNYQLSAIICHKGDLESGHYVVYCKHPKTNSWFKYDDRKVSQRTEAQILSRQAYIAFYTEILENDKQKPGEFFIPIEWAIRKKSMNNPGLIPFSDYMCKHNKISEKYSKKDFVKVSIDGISQFCNNIFIDSLDPCPECLNHRKKKLAKKERKLTQELIEENGKYLINREWFESWSKYLETAENPPLFINNSVLLSDKLERKPQTTGHKLWTALVYLYGTDQEIVLEGSYMIRRQPILYELSEKILANISLIKQKKLSLYQ